jgi:predicted amidohydrolase
MDGLFVPNLHQLGDDGGRGNLLGIEPYMVPQDYASQESFFEKLNDYLLAAQRKKWLNEKTIVLFPEYLGTWLVLAGESEKIFQSATLDSAERALVLRHPLKFISYFFRSREKGRAEAAFFRMKAGVMAGIYHNVFSQLARDHAVTIVAGSIVLPAPHISNRQLVPTDGPLRNSSVVYQPDGEPHPYLTCKVFPTARELPFTTPASTKDISSFDTPAGRIGVLICADSWYPEAYAALKEQRVDLLVVPSYDVHGMHQWNRPWAGYSGWQAPGDVDAGDVRKITEAQAWNKYSLAGRIRSSGAACGMNVFLRGKLWDQDLGGWPATLVRDDDVFVEEQTQQAAMLSLWL